MLCERLWNRGQKFRAGASSATPMPLDAVLPRQATPSICRIDRRQWRVGFAPAPRLPL
jgi:hypothetical protein